jgi:hypothetical protein
MFNKKHPNLYHALNVANLETSDNSNGKQEPSFEANYTLPFEKVCLA